VLPVYSQHPNLVGAVQEVHAPVALPAEDGAFEAAFLDADEELFPAAGLAVWGQFVDGVEHPDQVGAAHVGV
jgi:hypothetical protein